MGDFIQVHREQELRRPDMVFVHRAFGVILLFMLTSSVSGDNDSDAILGSGYETRVLN